MEANEAAVQTERESFVLQVCKRKLHVEYKGGGMLFGLFFKLAQVLECVFALAPFLVALSYCIAHTDAEERCLARLPHTVYGSDLKIFWK